MVSTILDFNTSELIFTFEALDESDIQILKTYVCSLEFVEAMKSDTPFQGQGPYAVQLKKVEGDIKEIQKRVNEKLGSRNIYISLLRARTN